MDLRVKARKRRKKNKWRSLKTSQTCGEIDISNSKSLFYHTPKAQARNCGKMHVSDPFFIKRTWSFCCDKMKNAHIWLQITLFCSISLWNDLSVRVVTYDWTVVFLHPANPGRKNEGVSWLSAHPFLFSPWLIGGLGWTPFLAGAGVKCPLVFLLVGCGKLGWMCIFDLNNGC